MHLPASMLQGQMCPLTIGVSVVTLIAVAKIYSESQQKVSPVRWGGVTALIFALQMLNFPIASGTSGHLVGGVLAASLLGIPAGILSMAMVLFIQAALFSDGGISALGANVINIAIVGAGFGGWLRIFLTTKKVSPSGAMAIAAFVSVILSALSCSVFVAGAGDVSWYAIASMMVSVHALIGLAEVFITLALFRILSKVFNTQNEKKIFWQVSFLCMAAILFSPLASSYPDALERVAMQLHLNFSQPTSLLSWFHDDLTLGIAGEGFLTVVGGLTGVAMLWSLTWGLTKVLRRSLFRMESWR